MSVFGKRNDPRALVIDSLSAAANQPLPTMPPARLLPTIPPERVNPLDPRVASLTSQAIIQAEEQHVHEVDVAIARAEAVAQEMRANFPAWAEGRLAAARARAEDVATGHAEILRCRDAFEAIRSGRVPALVASGGSLQDSEHDPLTSASPALGGLAESRRRLEELAQRLEAHKPEVSNGS